MKRILLFIFLLAAVFSCKKDEEKINDPTLQQEVSFAVNLLDPGGSMKSTDEWECKNLEPDYCQVTIGGVDYFPLVYRIDGVLYTQNIKLDIPPNGGSTTYVVSKFVLYDDGGTPGGTLPETGDSIVMGTPEYNSEYAVYVNQCVDFSITVSKFQKLEVAVDVLCFHEDVYTKFGFDWFEITELVIREQCFFGDFCVKHPDDYLGSYYANQSTGLQLDMPAIFEIHAYKDGTELFNSPFTNANTASNWGVGAPLCVEYADNLNVDGEVFTFDLWIYVKKGDDYIFKYFHTWTFEDEEMIPDGDDGIVEFVLGSCNLSGTDLQLAPYQNLPDNAYMQISYPGDPGYWNLKMISTTPAGIFDMPAGVWLTAWCGDAYHVISPGYHNVSVYTSLYNSDWPSGMPFDINTIAKVNWIMNHLGNYGMDMNTLTNAQGDVVQDAIWYLINGISCSGTALDMATDAGSHGDFVPLPGGWAAVLFIKNNMPICYQLIFTMVDP